MRPSISSHGEDLLEAGYKPFKLQLHGIVPLSFQVLIAHMPDMVGIP